MRALSNFGFSGAEVVAQQRSQQTESHATWHQHQKSARLVGLKHLKSLAGECKEELRFFLYGCDRRVVAYPSTRLG